MKQQGKKLSTMTPPYSLHEKESIYNS